MSRHDSALGDGDASRALSTLPPEIGSFAWQAERSDSQLARRCATAWPARRCRRLAISRRRRSQSVVAYLRTLPMRERNDRRASPRERTAASAAAARRTRCRCSSSRSRRRATGRASDARDRAFDAYLAFEPIETPARARDPGVVVVDGAALRRLQGRDPRQRHPRRRAGARRDRGDDAEGRRPHAAGGQRLRKRSFSRFSSFCAKDSRRSSSSAPSSRSCSRRDTASACAIDLDRASRSALRRERR